MHRFNFSRSVVLAPTVEVLPRGMLRLETAFRGKIEIRRRFVRLTTTKHLEGSFCVVDFGDLKDGKKPTAAVIAASRQSYLPKF